MIAKVEHISERIEAKAKHNATRHLSVNLLTEGEKKFLALLLPHDVPITLEVWAATLKTLLRRHFDLTSAAQAIEEYNLWTLSQHS